MKAIVIGLGSMGKRRIRLLQKNYPDCELAGIDAQESRREECKSSVKTYESLDMAIDDFKPECAFVCTSPLSHAKLIGMCLERGLHVFSEINLVDDGYKENTALAAKKGRTLFLSSTPLYRDEVVAARALVSAQTKPLLYSLHVGQYLPDWHPWESYKSFFLGDKRTNGCREIMGINLPWLIKTFGTVKKAYAIRSRLTELEVDYPDAYIVSLIHENGNIGTLTVDVAARTPVYDFNIIGEDLQLKWDGKPNTLQRYSINDKRWENACESYEAEQLAAYSANIVENAYLNEIKAFFAAIAGEAPRYTFEDDAFIVRLMDEIEREALDA